MVKKAALTIVGLLVVIGVAVGEEYDAIITDASRQFTKMKKSPEKFVYGKVRLDSNGKVVSTIYREGLVTKDTKVVQGTFDKKTKKWAPGSPIKGGVNADIFKERGKVVQVRVTVGDDNKTINRILVKTVGEPVVMADSEFDAVLKRVGPQTNGRGGIWYTRLELDKKGGVIKSLFHNSLRALPVRLFEAEALAVRLPFWPQALEEVMNGDDPNHVLTRLRRMLVVFAQATRAPLPGIRPS